jgi:peptide/nickel transport system permease protein
VPEITGRLLRHRNGRVALVVLGLLGLLCIVAPILAPAGPEAGSLSESLRRPGPGHWLGTDELGRDVLARLLWGGRVSLSVVALVTLAAPALGTAYGLAAAGSPTVLGELMLRLVDALLGVPRLPLYLVLLTLVGPGYWSLVLMMVAFEWPAFARLSYLGALGIQREPYVEAARALGADGSRLLRRHVWPGVAGPLLVTAAVAARGRIVAETSLSYLGFGIVPPTPSWGNMLSAAQSRIWVYPALALYPGLMILVVSVAAALLGDALRDAWDPTTASLASAARAARTNDDGTSSGPRRKDDNAHRADRLAT